MDHDIITSLANIYGALRIVDLTIDRSISGLDGGDSLTRTQRTNIENTIVELANDKALLIKAKRILTAQLDRQVAADTVFMGKSEAIGKTTEDSNE